MGRMALDRLCRPARVTSHAHAQPSGPSIVPVPNADGVRWCVPLCGATWLLDPGSGPRPNVNNVESAIVCLVAAALFVGWREWADGSATARARYLTLYRRSRSPIWIRNFLPLVPLWAISLVCGGIALVVPREAAIVALVPGTAVGLAAFALSYRSPAPLTPAWLRAATHDGTVAVARPYSLDWVLFVLVVPLSVLGEVGLVLLLIGGPGR